MSTTAPPIDPAGLAPGWAARARVLGHQGLRRAPAGIVSLGPALVAVALATMVAVLHWKGVDQAAQSYRVLQVRTHGLALWDSGW
ncbi:MAG: hypothetical protein M3Y91_09510, partial [Actinomycetota bacterium]|nr:hypothetical protein [Actinomycetota bacterium]